MREPLKKLPETYTLAGKLDLSENKTLAWVLNVFATVAFVGFAALLLYVAVQWRGQDVLMALSLQVSGAEALLLLAVLLALVLAILVVHELLHAAAFRLYIADGITFGFKGLYAFAAAPGWYLPRNQHLVAILAPLVVMTAVGLLLMLVAPVDWVPLSLFAIALNASGATGDMMTAVWLLTKPRTAYVNDYGDGFRVYADRETGDLKREA